MLYRVQPERTAIALPDGLQLRALDNGFAVGGIALVRRSPVSSSLLPLRLVTSKNVLHFLSVERMRRDHLQTGAIVMRYDTSSRWNAWVGRGWHWGRRHHHARVEICDSTESIRVRCDSDDHAMHLAFCARPRRDASRASVFQAKDRLLQMLQHDLRGVLPLRNRGSRTAGRRLCQSQLIPLRIEQLESSLFDDADHFADGAAEFDSAYWLRDDEVVWSGSGSLCCDIATA